MLKPMNYYDWSKKFKSIYDKALSQYQNGQRGAETFFNQEEQDFLSSIGATDQEIYDFAEDANNYNEPDYSTALLITSARRDYFFIIQKRVHSPAITPASALPAKTDKLEGIEWLPRILAKARLRLRGELDSDTMYCCGGDRRFLNEFRIHPADFLRLVWAAGDDSSKVVQYVTKNGDL